MLVSKGDIDTFRRDGVVHLPGMFAPEWLSLLSRGMDANLAAPSPRQEVHTIGDNPGPGDPKYIEDFWVWSLFPEFEEFVRKSPCSAIAADLLDARRINLAMDNWFVREAGATSRPPWHHDIAYFDFEGSMCVLWLPLEDTSKENGIAFVRGSHLWDRLFMRIKFTDHAAGGDPGWVNGQHYELPPDIDTDPDAYDLARFDCQAGDCIMFDIRTLHGALKTVVPKNTQRRFTLRMAAEDARLKYRGDWAKGERDIFEAAGHKEGDAMCSDFFPTLWEAGGPDS